MTIYRVGSWTELFGLPNFEREPVQRDVIKKGRLVGDYEMAGTEGLRPCGIAKCERDHRHGYIVELPDLRMSHVGRDCGKTHFGASWAQAKKALNTAKRQAAKQQAVIELKAAIQSVIESWPSFDAPVYRAVRTILLQFDALPDKLRDTLENRAQEGDVSVSDWREPTEQERQQAKFHERKYLPRVKIERGPLVGLRGINPKTRMDFLVDSQRAVLMREASALIEMSDAKGDELSAMLRRLRPFLSCVEVSIQQLQTFIGPSNLKTITYLLPAKDLEIEGISYDSTSATGFLIKYRGCGDPV